MMALETEISFGVLLAGAALAGWMFYLEKHPPKDLRPRLVPTTLFLFVGGLIAVGAGIHLLGQLGFHPPAPQP